MNSEDFWAEYARTIIDIAPRGRELLRISPRPKGEVGLWPSWLDTSLCILTAWNPGTNRFSIKVNRARQNALTADLHRFTEELWPCVRTLEHVDRQVGFESRVRVFMKRGDP